MSYSIGYGKPPKRNQFRKGQSGNPRGRPKGSVGIPEKYEERCKELLLGAAYQPVTVRKGERTFKKPAIQQIFDLIVHQALKGDFRSQKLVLQRVGETEDGRKEFHNLCLQTAIEYKAKWERDIEHCRRYGLPIPEPFPHPDNVLIDEETGNVTIVGQLQRSVKEVLQLLDAKWKEKGAALIKPKPPGLP
jgi:hypothetical protein